MITRRDKPVASPLWVCGAPHHSRPHLPLGDQVQRWIGESYRLMGMQERLNRREPSDQPRLPELSRRPPRSRHRPVAIKGGKINSDTEIPILRRSLQGAEFVRYMGD